VAALAFHAGLTYRDNFRVWGPSAATFDAFEGDMTAAWRWLDSRRPNGYVYLSSDIYRHLTFAFLREQASVQEIFTYQDAGLSMFDARGALPLPPPGRSATYLLAASSLPTGPAAEWLAAVGQEREPALAPDGNAALQVIQVGPDARSVALPVTAITPISLTGELTLTGAGLTGGPDGAALLWLRWQAAGPVVGDWRGYTLEAGAGDAHASRPFDSFRATEWAPGGEFLTWHALPFTRPGATLRLRLLRVDGGEPFSLPGATDGWREITLPRQ
jgi:hypothetical protein